MSQSFKKIGFAVLFTALTALSVPAQTTKPEKLKKHHCTEKCTKEKHVYAHGEKGHTCDASCKSKMQ